MPDEAERAAMLGALISNGLDFVERAVSELKEASAPKFSIAHFATGIELLLKARLFHEHWALVGSTPHSVNWTAVADGTFITVQASQLVAALETLTPTSLRREKEAFEAVFKHRNQVLHFVPRAKERVPTAAEQLRSWYFMHNLLVDRWGHVYQAHATRIDEVDVSLRSQRAYLQVIFDDLTQTRALERDTKRAGVIACPSCEFMSGVLDAPSAFRTLMKCAVCKVCIEMRDFGCGNWERADESLDEEPCACGLRHTEFDLSYFEDGGPTSSTVELDIVNCGSCLRDSTAQVAKAVYRCSSCGAVFARRDVKRCEGCGQGWVGYDCTGTEVAGCEFCDPAVEGEDDEEENHEGDS